MDTIALVGKKREKFGSKRARGMRREGIVPAVLYGHGMESLSLEVEKRELIHALHTKAGENVVIDLNVEGAKLKESTCRIKAIQHHPVTDEIQHVDFTVISLREKIEVSVPLHVLHSDECVGVKENGVLDVVHHEIPLECLPTQIPENIEIDIKELKIGDAIHTKDLPLSEGVVINLDAEEVILAVHAPRVEEEKVEEEGEEAGQPEVIEKGKKAEDEAGAEPGGSKPEQKSE